MRVVTVDAFTSVPFAGNPAAVCITREARTKEWMLNVAREMNLSETAFLVPGNGDFDLRWFTPTVEMDLCGHATVASAHVLWEDGHLHAGRQARFQTRSGLLTADRRGEWIEMDFPATVAKAIGAPPELLPALGIESVVAVGQNRFDYLVEVASEEVVRGLSPDLSALCKLPVRGVIVTARSATPDFDFVSRFFAPAAGINEDPVTGSAHTALAPYWAEKLGKPEMAAYQASARGGVVRLRMNGDRVMMAGQAITMMRAELIA